MSLIETLRPEARFSPVSGIEAVMNYGRGRPGLIPLWAGEGDLPTPDFINKAAARGLAEGETFYTWQAGIPGTARVACPLSRPAFRQGVFPPTSSSSRSAACRRSSSPSPRRSGLATRPSTSARHGRTLPPRRASTAARLSPVRLDQGDNGWFCDVEKIAAAITPRTRAIFVNSPANPTGWTADRETLQSILDLARRHDLWIVADEIYALFHFGGRRAASFMDIMEPEDRILFVNSFSKNWAMTGWRVGWMRTHPSLGRMFENLIQYSSSGVAQFLQRGAIAALDEGDAFIAEQVARAQQARDLVCRILGDTGRVKFSVPPGAFYLFFSVDGLVDAERAAFDIVDQANVGLAPGTAFGPRRRRIFAALLPPPPRPGRGSRQSAGGVDQEGLRNQCRGR